MVFKKTSKVMENFLLRHFFRKKNQKLFRTQRIQKTLIITVLPKKLRIPNSVSTETTRILLECC